MISAIVPDDDKGSAVPLTYMSETPSVLCGKSRVIVHADDFGRSNGTTLGVVQCIDRGAITSMTVLANMPGTGQALGHAVTLQDRISIGVHLNLCEGRPLTSAPSLIDDNGFFYTKRAVLVRALFRRFSVLEVERELVAQAAVLKDAGIAISHFDGHKHLHLIPGITRVIANVARRFGIERVRCPVRSAYRHLPTRSACAPILARTCLARLASRQFTAAGLRHPDRLFDLQDLFSSSRSRRSRLSLMRARGLTEIMCHPISGSPRDVPEDLRTSDAAILLSEEFSCLLRDANVALCTYWDC